MNINELLDTIEDALEESANMPLSGGKRIVDVDQIRDYLDEVRANLPGELRQAQAIVNDRAQIVDSANAQAQAIVHKAEERARILVSESEIVKNAQQRASEIMAQAQAESRTLRQTTADYCDNMLKTTAFGPACGLRPKNSSSKCKSHKASPSFGRRRLF